MDRPPANDGILLQFQREGGPIPFLPVPLAQDLIMRSAIDHILVRVRQPFGAWNPCPIILSRELISGARNLHNCDAVQRKIVRNRLEPEPARPAHLDDQPAEIFDSVRAEFVINKSCPMTVVFVNKGT